MKKNTILLLATIAFFISGLQHIFAQAPTTQASNVVISDITGNSANVSWTNGNGANRVVFIAQTSIGLASPAVNRTYSANAIYGRGSQIGSTGWYTVYNSSQSSASLKITGLSSTKTYRVMVMEYTGTSRPTAWCTSTNSNNPVNFTTIADASLSSLSLSAGSLSPSFSSSIFSYTNPVVNAITNITVTPIALDTAATITVNGSAVQSGSASSIALNVGDNTITIVVTSTLSSTIFTTTITLKRDDVAPVFSYSGPNHFYQNTVSSLSPTNTVGIVGTPGTNYQYTIASGFLVQSPHGLATDVNGNVYLADSETNSIVKILASNGTKVTLNSSFNYPTGVAVSATGTIYIAGYNDNSVWKMNADGTGKTQVGSGFNKPEGVAVDASGNVYVADTKNNKIKKVLTNGTIETLGGTYTFSGPLGIGLDSQGNIYIANSLNGTIQKIPAAGGAPTTLATLAKISYLAVDTNGTVYATDFGSTVYSIASDGSIATVGTGFNNSSGIALDSSNNIFVSDWLSGKVTKITRKSGYYVAPSLPTGISLDPTTGVISGTPTILSSAANYTITGYNYYGSGTATLNISVFGTPTTWTGTNSTAWSDAGNWSNSSIPLSSSNVIIAAATNQPLLSADLSINSLTINSGASLTVPTGVKLTVNNHIDNSGALTVENNANLIQTAATNTNSGSGTTIVKRDSNSLKRLDYTMWSSPVTGTQTLLQFSPLTSALSPVRFYTFNPGNNVYSVATVTSPFATGTGYLIRMPNEQPSAVPTVGTGIGSEYYKGNAALAYNGVFTGTLNNGQVTVTTVADKYNALGNPYPSTMSANSFLSGNATAGTLYFWRKTNGAGGSAYATYTASLGGAAGASGTTPNGTIQVGQGFIVKASSTSVSFNNTMRETAPTSTQFLKTKKVADKSRLWLDLSNANGRMNQVLIGYLDGATTGFDAGIDGKYFNDSKIALTSIVDAEEYVIQGRPTFDAADVVALGFKTDVAGDYTIALNSFDGVFESGQDVYLVDAVAGKEIDLKAGSYSFTATAGVDNARFRLKYQKTLKVDAPAFNDNSVKVYKNNGAIVVNSTSKAIKTIAVYDVQGRLLAQQKNVNATTATITNIKAVRQVLIVKISADDNSVVSKKVLN